MYSEETASPGLWKSEIIGLVGLWLIGSAFVLQGNLIVYNNWLAGLVAGNIAIGMAGERKWERPVAAAAAIWLVISGFVPSVQSGTNLLMNQIGVGVILVISAVSAHIHLLDDIRHDRPLTM
jgi:hypothetical protein